MFVLETIAAIGAIVTAYKASQQLFSDFKTKRHARRQRKEQELENSLVTCPQLIHSEYDRGYQRFRQRFERGDDNAQNQLLAVRRQLESTLISTLLSVIRDGQGTFSDVLIISENARTETIFVLRDLEQRLLVQAPIPQGFAFITNDPRNDTRAFQVTTDSSLIPRGNHYQDVTKPPTVRPSSQDHGKSYSQKTSPLPSVEDGFYIHSQDEDRSYYNDKSSDEGEVSDSMMSVSSTIHRENHPDRYHDCENDDLDDSNVQTNPTTTSFHRDRKRHHRRHRDYDDHQMEEATALSEMENLTIPDSDHQQDHHSHRHRPALVLTLEGSYQDQLEFLEIIEDSHRYLPPVPIESPRRHYHTHTHQHFHQY